MPIKTERNKIRRMFDTIAFRYDFVNRVLSLRRDVAWRKAMVAALPKKQGLHALDLATGTGDVLLALQKPGSSVTHVIGADVSGAMLRHGQQKIKQAGYAPSSALTQTDAAALCFPDNVFDVVTAAFGVRNFSELETGLREIFRVLRPGGCVIILEFSLPTNPFLRAAYLVYFRHVLPRIAGLLSRQPAAYHYLNRSVEAFPYGESFCALLHDSGYTENEAHPLSFGIATLYVGYKPLGNHDQSNLSETIERIKEFKEKHSLDGLSIDDMVNEGRK